MKKQMEIIIDSKFSLQHLTAAKKPHQYEVLLPLETTHISLKSMGKPRKISRAHSVQINFEQLWKV